jgi:hypothetical protein
MRYAVECMPHAKVNTREAFKTICGFESRSLHKKNQGDSLKLERAPSRRTFEHPF